MAIDRQAEAVPRPRVLNALESSAGLDGTAARRLAESVDAALAELRRDPLDDRGIHHARRALKKARAALRLLRPAWGENHYRLENQALRDAGRLLSPLRDARAVLDGLDDLARRLEADSPAQPAIAEVRTRVERELRLARRLMRRPSEALERCIGLLEAHRIRRRVAQAARLERGPVDPGLPREALRRLYRKARRQLDRADRGRAVGAEALHEWRKQVKYLLNAAMELRDYLGPRADSLIARAEAISEDLGAEHDLAVLASRLDTVSADGRGSTDPGMDALRRLIERRRAKLRGRALEHGRVVYRRKPHRFVARLFEHAPPTDAPTVR